MKILLLTPNLSVHERYGSTFEKLGSMSSPPLGLGYIGAVLEKEKHKVEIIDTTLSSLRKTLSHLKKNKFDLIGITLLTPSYQKFKELLKKIKPIIKNIPIVVGGSHASIMPIETLKDNKEIDYIIYGEGEETIIELIDFLKGKKELKKIKGLGYRKNKKIILNPPREFIKNLDDLPSPSFHLFEMKKYTPAISQYKKLPCVHIITSRGCPFHCTFCSSRSTFGLVYRFHSVGRVIEEIRYLIHQYGAKEISFSDDIFTLNRKWITELCDRLIEEKLNKKIVWSCNTRVNCVDLNLLKKMKIAGCWQVHYGIESGSQRLLNIIKKGITLKQAENAVKWAKKAGIRVRAYFMLGLPTETREESIQTIEFAKTINPYFVRFALTTPYPNTDIYNELIKKGEIKPMSWDKYQNMLSTLRRPYVPKGRTNKELNELHKRAYREFFLRPRIMITHFFSIRSISEFKMNLRGLLAILKMFRQKC